MTPEKAANFQWAVGLLRDAIDAGTYGSLTFSMQNGIIGNAKTETVAKPPVDSKPAKP